MNVPSSSEIAIVGSSRSPQLKIEEVVGARLCKFCGLDHNDPGELSPADVYLWRERVKDCRLLRGDRGSTDENDAQDSEGDRHETFEVVVRAAFTGKVYGTVRCMVSSWRRESPF